MPFAVSFDAVSNADALSRSVADDDSEAVNSNSLRRGTRVLPTISLTLTSRPTPNVGDLNSFWNQPSNSQACQNRLIPSCRQRLGIPHHIARKLRYDIEPCEASILTFGNFFPVLIEHCNLASSRVNTEWLQPLDWLIFSSQMGWFPILLLSYFQTAQHLHSLSIHTSWISADPSYNGFGCKSLDLCHRDQVPLCNPSYFVEEWTLRFLGKHTHEWWWSNYTSYWCKSLICLGLALLPETTMVEEDSRCTVCMWSNTEQNFHWKFI